MNDNSSRSADARLCANAPARGRWLTLCTLSAAVLIAQLDTSVVNLAARPVGAYFHAGVDALQWIVDSYNFVYAVLLLTGGHLADLYGRRRIFLVGTGVFTAASLWCALAPTVPVLIAGRVLAGIGAALLLPASLAIIRVVWPEPTARAKVLGIWTGCNGLALAIGPTLGGVLIEHFGWRSIFLIVVPLGLAAWCLALPSIPESTDPEDRDFGIGAQVLGALALGGFVLAAIETHASTGAAAAAFAAGAVCLITFIRFEKARGAGALVPLDMFRHSEFRGSIAATTGMTFGMYGVLFLVPLTWQSSGLLGPVGAGVALMPMALVFVIVSPFSGTLMARVGQRPMTGGGLAVIACGLLLIAMTASASRFAPAEVGLALTGLGMGLATGPLMGAAVGAVPARRSGTAAASSTSPG